MKKFFSFLFITLLAAGTVQANAQTQRGRADARRKENRPRPIMSQPVYADAPGAQNQFKGEIPPEQLAKFNAARKRRFEIMVLIGAYKIMPEAERHALKAELLKRIEADFQAMLSDQKERIAKAEADLQRFRKELADRENRHQEFIERELDRLLKMQPRPRGKQTAK